MHVCIYVCMYVCVYIYTRTLTSHPYSMHLFAITFLLPKLDVKSTDCRFSTGSAAPYGQMVHLWQHCGTGFRSCL